MTVVVGSAEIIVKANTRAFAADVETQTKPAFAEMEREAGAAGERSGAAMAAGVRTGTATMAAETRAAGAAAGAGMAKPVEDGAKRSETAMVTAAASGHKAFLGATAAILGAAGEGVHLAETMQTTDAAIAGAAGTSVAAAKRVGDALLGTAGKSEFSGLKQAQAYQTVAAQLKTVEGRALSAGEAQDFMRVAGDLAIAKQIDLGVATAATASTIQGFGLKTKDAAHAADVLFNASNATGVSVDAMATQLSRLHSKLGDTAGSLTDVGGLLVDMTERGITGRAAMAAVNSGLNTLQKTAGAVTTSMKHQDDAFAAMPAGLQRLVHSYQTGQISQAEFSKATKVLNPEQKALVTAFNSSASAVEKAQAKYKGLGIDVFDAHGKFVGMDKIIAQLQPKFAKMTQQQQLAAASTLFGAGAARQMTAVINAGTTAYEKATSTVGRHNAVQNAADKQSKTLHRELQTLGATVSDVATEFGQVLVPAVTSVIHVVGQGTHFLLEHKTAAEALAAVIGGVLSVAVGVFTVNKMAGMVKSIRLAGSELRAFAGVASSVAKTVIGRFGAQAVAAETGAAKIEASQAAERTAVTTTATTVQAENAATGQSFVMVGTNAGAGAAAVEGKVAAEATAVGAADAAIEAENVAAGASFTAMLGPIGAVAAAIVGLHQLDLGGNLNSPGGLKDKIRQIKAAVNAQTTAGLTASAGVPGPPRHPNLSPVAHVHTSSTHVSAGATTGLTAKQRKQLAAIVSGGGKSSSGSGGSGSPGSSSSSHPSGYTRTTFAEAVLKALGAPVTRANVKGLVGWEIAEGGNWDNPDKFNPFNTTKKMPGAHSTNSAGVKSYTSWAQGLTATVQTLQNGNYGPILDVLRGGHGGSALAHAVGATPWGTSTAGVLSGIARAHVGALSGTATMHPVDVTRWARSQIGHDAESRGNNRGPELDQLQRQFHTLGAAWCAEFATTAALMGGAHKAVRTASTNVIAAEARAGTHGYEKGIKRRGRAGDLVLLHGSDGYRQHVGFVESVNEKKGTFTTIEGNTSAGKVARVVHRMSDSEGFARPIYQNGAGFAGAAPGLSRDAKALVATNKTVTRQEEGFAKWLAAENAKRALMTTAEKRALNEQIAIRRSAVGIEVTQEYAALTTQTRQQAAHLKQAGADQKLGTTMLNKMVAAAHSGSLTKLQGILQKVDAAGFDGLIKRLSHDHIAGFSQLVKQLTSVHKAAMAKQVAEQTKAAADAWKKVVDAMDQLGASRISSDAQIATDTTNAQVQAIQDQTKVTLDQQAEIGKTGADLLVAQDQTHLDQIAQANDAVIGVAQLAVDKAAGGTQTEQATAAANLAAAQGAAALAQAQAQATLDLDTAAAQTADAATAAAQAAQDAAGTSTPLGGPGLPPNATFNFTINGHNMTAGELMGEVGWALKTGALPVAPGSPAAA